MVKSNKRDVHSGFGLKRAQGTFEYLLLISGGVLLVILAVAIVRTSITTNSNSVNKSAGGYQDFVGIRSEQVLYSIEVKADCVAGWAFNEGTGTSTAVAKGSITNNGTLTHGPTWTTGIRGNAIQFDGSDDYVNTSQSSTFNLTSYTISAWVNTTNTAGYQDIFENGGSAYNAGGYALTIDRDIGGFAAVDCFTINATGGQYQQVQGTTNMSSHKNEWHHLVCSFDGTTTRLYVDGVQEGSDTTPVITMVTPPFATHIGAIAENSQYFTGRIDEVALYNRSLADYEIARLYSAKEFWCS